MQDVGASGGGTPSAFWRSGLLRCGGGDKQDAPATWLGGAGVHWETPELCLPTPPALILSSPLAGPGLTLNTAPGLELEQAITCHLFQLLPLPEPASSSVKKGLESAYTCPIVLLTLGCNDT